MMESNLREAFVERHRALAEQLTGEMPLSPVAEARIGRLLKRRERFYYPLINTAFKRVACIVAAVLLFGSAVTVGVSSLQRKAPNLDIYTYETGVEIRLDYKAIPFISRQPSYLPEGFTLRWDRSEEQKTYLFYEGEGGGFFCFAQYPSGSRATQYIGLQSYEEVLIAEKHEGIYIQNGAYTYLLFTEGDYMYLLNGTLPQEELFAVAASVFES